MNWHEKVALITGASSGIGRETARLLHRLGTSVVLAARRKDRIDALAEELDDDTSGRAFAVQTDVGREEEVDRLFTSAMQRYGRIDWLIHNAGSGLYASIEETTSEQMERLWRTNFMGTFYSIRKAIPVMKRQGGGHILTVSSMAGARGNPMNGAYCATKFAQIGLMDSLRRELEGIHCTVVLPGPTDTEFIESMENPSAANVRHSGFVQEPKEIAKAIVNAIEHPAARVISQKLGRTLLVLNAFSPSFTDWLIANTFKKNS